jgi:hypothetical protein
VQSADFFLDTYSIINIYISVYILLAIVINVKTTKYKADGTCV